MAVRCGRFMVRMIAVPNGGRAASGLKRRMIPGKSLRLAYFRDRSWCLRRPRPSRTTRAHQPPGIRDPAARARSRRAEPAHPATRGRACNGVRARRREPRPRPRVDDNAHRRARAAGPQPWHGPAAWDRVAKGMTEAQVIAILGEPTAAESVGALKTLFYRGSAPGGLRLSGLVNLRGRPRGRSQQAGLLVTLTP